MSLPQASPKEQPIRRARVTYGRRSASNAQTGSTTTPLAESRKRSFETEIIPDSEPPLTGGPEDEPIPPVASNSEPGESAAHAWSWKKELAAIDDLDDANVGKRLGSARSERDGTNGSRAPSPARSRTPTIPIAAASTSGSSLTWLSETSQHLSSPPRPGPSSNNHYRSPRLIIDSPSLNIAEDSQAAESSPHPFGTPQDGPSQTPPTSDDDQDFLPKPPKSSSLKGKERARDTSTLSEDSVAPPTPPRRAKSKRNSAGKSKTKRPTKKDRRDAMVENARIRSDREVKVSSSTTKMRTLTQLLEQIPHPVNGSKAKPLAKQSSEKSLISDIQSFSESSPRAASLADSTSASTEEPMSPPEFRPNGLLISRRSPSSPLRPSAGALGRKPPPPRTPSTSYGDSGLMEDVPPLPDDSEEEEFPDFAVIMKQREEAQRKKRLEELKMAGMQNPVTLPDDEDDELVVTDEPRTAVREAEVQRRGRMLPSSIQERQLGFSFGRAKAVRELATPSKKRSMPSKDDLARAARPSFGMDVRSGRPSDHVGLTKEQLDRLNLRKAEKRAAESRATREAEWVRRGGQIQEALPDKQEEARRQLAEIAAKRAEEAASAEAMDVDEEDEDADYVPAGSDSEVADSEDEVDENLVDSAVKAEAEAGEEDSSMARDLPEVTHEEEPDSPSLRPQRRLVARKPAARVVVESDSESETENALAENDAELTDKENVKGGLSEPGEEKENAKVQRAGPLFSLTSTPKTTRHEGQRSPFKEIVTPTAQEMDNPFDDSAPAPSLQPAAFIKQTGGMSQFFGDDEPVGLSAAAPAPSLQPAAFIGSGKGQTLAFSDDEDDAAADFSAPSASSSGLAPAFGEGTKEPTAFAFGGLADEFESSQETSTGGLDSLRVDPSALSASQDDRTKILQPALEVTDELRQKFDEIFEKEQEYIIAAARPAPQKPQYYVNDIGYLTQTRPEGDDVQIWRPSPSQSLTQKLFRSQTQSALTPTQAGKSPAFSLTQSNKRTPLGTLALSQDEESPAPRRLFRKGEILSRNGDDDEGGYRSSSPSPSKSTPKGRDAFKELMEKARKQDKGKRRNEKSEFVEAEAEEDDEDDMFGFGDRKKDDDDDDEEDDGKDLEGLVDDQVMGEEELRRKLVQEKAAEHAAEADAALEKDVRDVVTGLKRQKRRNGGLDIESSDEEEEDEDGHRRPKPKKRKIDGDTLEDLGKSEETKAFHDSYYNSLNDDGAEFAHLNGHHDEDMDGDDDGRGESGGEEQEYVATSALEAQLRQAAQNANSFKSRDPHDVSWAETDDEDDHPRNVKVRFVDNRPHAEQSSDADELDLLRKPSGRRNLDHAQSERQMKWAAEAGAASRATARAGAGASVTGVKKRQVAAQPTSKPKPVKKSESMLNAAIGRRNVQRRG